jgi:hypothetical protein
MRNRIAMSMIVVSLGLIVGCGAPARMITAKAQSEKSDVFTEVTDAGATPQGFADIIVKANTKTHEEGYYIGESDKSLHGKPGYPFVLNIDGQAAVWKVDGKKEELPKYDEQGKTSRDPEAGTGIKYVLEKKLRLRPGSHNLFFGLPGEDYYTEVVITGQEGESRTLEFKPVYRYKTNPTRIPTFKKGISGYAVYLDGGALIR